MTLLLIGKGRWSEKVSNSIQSGLPKLPTKVVGAREFLTDVSSYDLESIEYVWITSQPALQLEILKSLESFTGKILIEKPIGLSSTDFNYLKDSIHTQRDNLRLSKVWNYSAIWLKLKSFLQSNLTHIEITRGGPNHNSSIPLHIDWLPHDVFLLTDLFGESMLRFKKISRIIKDELLQAEIQIADKDIVVNLCTGKLKEGRVAEWRFFSGSKLLLMADFSKGEIILENGESVIPKLNQDAISGMVLDIPSINRESVQRDIRVQERFGKLLLGM